MSTSYHEQPGADNDDTREYLRLAFEAHAMHSLPAARRLRTFWSEHVSTSDGTQFTVTHAEPACPTCGGEGNCPDCEPTFASRYIAPMAAPAALTRVITRHYGPGAIIGVAADNHDDILVKLDTATSYGSQTVWQARSEVEAVSGAPALEKAILMAIDLTCDLTRNWAHVVASPPGFPDDDDDSPDGGGPPRAATLQSIEIERRLFVCKNCQGIHPTQKCPKLRSVLFAEEPAIAVYETQEMIRLWSVSRTLLVAKLRRLTRPQLVCQAVAFAAWLNERTQSGLSAASVLHIWETMLDDGPTAPAAMMRAA